jgi:midasin
LFINISSDFTMSLQEADNTMNIEGSPSVRQWLRESTSSLLADLGLTTSSATSSPITMPRIIFNMSSSPDVPSDGDIFVLLEALSHLAAVGGVAELILNRFRPLALDLLARWLENSSNVEFELWERRLCVIAAFCVAPDLWRWALSR